LLHTALRNSTETQLEDMNITYEQTYKKLKEIRKDKSQGPDELSPANIAEEIVYPVYHMIQNSLDTGIIPEDWKTTNITPIHKGGSKHQASNYRPISLTSLICKIIWKPYCETIEIVRHLENNRLIHESQHGFRRGRSCLTNIVAFLDKVTDVVDKSSGDVDVVFIDLAKAFDKVPHKRLLIKLKDHGIDGKVLQWIENWLKGRKQRVHVKGLIGVKLVASYQRRATGIRP